MRLLPGVVRVVGQPLQQDAGDFLGRAKRSSGFFAIIFRRMADERGRRIGPIRLHRRRLFRLMRHQPLRQRPLGERRMSRQQEIQRAAEAVDVGPVIDRVAVERLLRAR